MEALAGSAFVSSPIALSMPSRTVRMFAPICCEIVMAVALPPCPTMSDDRSGDPCVTWARSLTRSVVPPLMRMGVFAISESDSHSPDASTRCCTPFSG